jgi:hypothetical protein
MMSEVRWGNVEGVGQLESRVRRLGRVNVTTARSGRWEHSARYRIILLPSSGGQRRGDQNADAQQRMSR